MDPLGYVALILVVAIPLYHVGHHIGRRNALRWAESIYEARVAGVEGGMTDLRATLATLRTEVERLDRVTVQWTDPDRDWLSTATEILEG